MSEPGRPFVRTRLAHVRTKWAPHGAGRTGHKMVKDLGLPGPKLTCGLKALGTVYPLALLRGPHRTWGLVRAFEIPSSDIDAVPRAVTGIYS